MGSIQFHANPVSNFSWWHWTTKHWAGTVLAIAYVNIHHAVFLLVYVQSRCCIYFIYLHDFTPLIVVWFKANIIFKDKKWWGHLLSNEEKIQHSTSKSIPRSVPHAQNILATPIDQSQMETWPPPFPQYIVTYVYIIYVLYIYYIIVMWYSWLPVIPFNLSHHSHSNLRLALEALE